MVTRTWAWNSSRIEAAGGRSAMVFSSNLFVFGFMPIFFGAYYLVPESWKNPLIFLASIVFYAFGAGPVVAVLIFSVTINYGAAIGIASNTGRLRQLIFWLAVIANLAALFYFKYFNFAWQVANGFTEKWLELDAFRNVEVALPIGISFFTFQALSYIADVYSGHCPVEKSVIRFGMYHTLFPQLIAGPIVRYVEIRSEVAKRNISMSLVAEGLTRFAIGLGKKTIIADNVGRIADQIFGLNNSQVLPSVAWLGATAYGIQILFDFSGYSDMAIGLGRLLGFHFPENFNHPYLSQNITEFWRRWHMTLSRWFRDYLYIPLGGNRRGPARTYLNLVIVFFLCGLWHGAGFTFVAWGLFHGAFLAGEHFARNCKMPLPKGLPGQVYTLVVVSAGWILFRSSDLTQAGTFLREMLFVDPRGFGAANVLSFLPRDRACYLLIGVAIAILPLRTPFAPGDQLTSLILQRAATLLLFVYSAAMMSEGTFNPFIYLRF
jgi:alginate O-acetyltransferase complex protein AlgI